MCACLCIVYFLSNCCFTDRYHFQDSERAVTKEEGIALAQEHECLFFECSAKTQANVKQCFKELTVKVYHAYTPIVPILFEKSTIDTAKRNLIRSTYRVG